MMISCGINSSTMFSFMNQIQLQSNGSNFSIILVVFFILVSLQDHVGKIFFSVSALLGGFKMKKELQDDEFYLISTFNSHNYGSPLHFKPRNTLKHSYSFISSFSKREKKFVLKDSIKSNQVENVGGDVWSLIRGDIAGSLTWNCCFN